MAWVPALRTPSFGRIMGELLAQPPSSTLLTGKGLCKGQQLRPLTHLGLEISNAVL